MDTLMLARTLFALSLTFGLAFPVAAAPKAAPKECPRNTSDRDQIVQDLAKAQTCSAALEIFQLCAGGGSGDSEFGGAVVERCEADFLAKLSNAQKRTYDAEGRRCVRKYRNKEGTMYIALTAYCVAEVADRYARRFGKAKPATRP